VEFIERFQREAKAISELVHPHMVRVYDSGRDGTVHYIAMEYVEGANLKEYIRREGRLSPERALQIAAQVCEALEFAHSHGVVHRDSPIAIALSHVHKTPPAPSSLVPGLPERVEGVIARALMKSSSDRYRSAVEMRADLLGETELWRVPPATRGIEDTPLTMVLPGGAVETEAKAAP